MWIFRAVQGAGSCTPELRELPGASSKMASNAESELHSPRGSVARGLASRARVYC